MRRSTALTNNIMHYKRLTKLVYTTSYAAKLRKTNKSLVRPEKNHEMIDV